MAQYLKQEFYLQLFSKPQALYLLIILLLISIVGIVNLTTSANYRVYFDKNDELLEQEAKLTSLYDTTDGVLLVINSDSSLLSDENWLALNKLSDQLMQLESIHSINSFISLARAIDSAPLIDDPDNIDEFNQAQIKIRQSEKSRLSYLIKHPRALNLISQNGKNALFDLELNINNRNSAKEILLISHEIETLTKRFTTQSNSITDIKLGGIHALNTAYINVVRHDLKFFIPLLLLIFSVGLFYFFGNVKIVFLILGLGLTSVLSAFGFAGWVGLELAAVNAFSPVIIISLSIATSVHLLTNYFRYLANSNSCKEAMNKSLSKNYVAILLSNLTTASGFLLLSTSPSPPIRVVGYVVAFGVIVNYFCSQILLPIWLRKIDCTQKNHSFLEILERWQLKSLGKKILSHSRTINLTMIFICILSLLSLSKLQVNDNVYQYFDDEHPFKHSIQNIEDNFIGVSSLQFSFDSGKQYGLFESDYLNYVNKFSSWIANQPEVASVNNINQLIKFQEQSIGSLVRMAKTVDVSQSSLTAEISHNYRHSKVTVILNSTSTRHVLELDKNSQIWLSKNISPFQVTGGVSPDLIFAQLGWRNSTSLFYSLVIALAFVAILAGIMFRSLSFIFMALLCNILPLSIVFAIWVELGGFLSLGSSVVMGMIMGILIDDTLHLLIRYHQYKSNEHREPVLKLYSSVAPAVIITSLTLMAGLVVGIFSQFRPIVELSGLSIAIILSAMIVDLIWLPILMTKWGSKPID